MSRPIPAVALALALVLAGCGGPLGTVETPTPGATATPGTSASPGATDAPTGTATPDEPGYGNVTVRGGSLPVNVTAVWHRFLELRGFAPDAYSPPVVEVKEPHEGERVLGPRTRHHELAVNLGFEPVRIDLDDFERPIGKIGIAGTIVVRPNEGTPEEIERTLVHEFEHYVQPDSSLAGIEFTVSEGAAVYVEVAYARLYLESIDAAEDLRTAYIDAMDARKIGAARYYFGYRYVDRRIDSPADLDVVYDDPPESAAQLLHGHDWNGSRPLAVESGEGWRESPAPAGELFLRTALATETNESTAARAAAGWANDTVLKADGGTVWVIRTNDERNASELEAAFGRHFDAMATAEGDVWRSGGTVYRLVRVDATILAVVIGNEAFASEVTVAVDDGTVTVARETEAVR